MTHETKAKKAAYKKASADERAIVNNSDTLPGAEYTTDEQILASSITLRTDECHSGRLSKIVDWIYSTAGDMMFQHANFTMEETKEHILV